MEHNPLCRELTITLNQLCHFKDTASIIKKDKDGDNVITIQAKDVVSNNGTQALASILNYIEELTIELLINANIDEKTANEKYMATHGYPIFRECKPNTIIISTSIFKWKYLLCKGFT